MILHKGVDSARRLVSILKSCRERSHVSQRELARTAHVPDCYIRDMEQREKLPRKDLLFRIAFALELVKRERKEVFGLIHEISQTRKERRRYEIKLRRHPLTNAGLRRFNRLLRES